MGKKDEAGNDVAAESGLLGANAKMLGEVKKPADGAGETKKADEKGDEGKSEIDLMKEKIDKIQSSTQSRIDRLIADTKTKDEIIKNLSEVKVKENATDPADEIRTRGDVILDSITEIEISIGQAQLDGDTTAISKLVRKREEARLQITSLENEYQDLKRSKTKKEADTKTEAQLATNRTAWNESYIQAGEQFEGLIVDGKLDTESALVQKAFKIMSTGAKDSKFLPEVGGVNPKYDHANGPLMALLEAHVALSKDGSNKEVKKVKQEINKLKQKEQLLDSNLNVETTPADEKILTDYREAVAKGDFQSPAIIKFLNKENKRAGLI